MLYRVSPAEITIYITGKNTDLLSVANILHLKKLYPELSDRIIYIEENNSRNKIDIMKENNINYKIYDIEEKIDEYTEKYTHIKEHFLDVSLRHMLLIDKALSDCNTKYAVLMHNDMIIKDNNVIYKLIDDLKENKVSSIKREDRPSLNTFVFEFDDLVYLLNKKNMNYYVNHIVKNHTNLIWAGLMAMDLNYFKENNLPYGDRLDDRNLTNLSSLFCDTSQDFQCFLVENNIPFKSYEPEFLNVYHLKCASITKNNIKVLNINFEDWMKKIIKKTEAYEALKLISDNSGISIRKIINNKIS